MFKRSRSIVVISLALISASCTSPVGPQDSGISLPNLWARVTGDKPMADLNAPLAASPDAGVEQKWWTRFDDPVLDGLIAEALVNNKTLQLAKARVDEASAGRVIARAALLPEINAVGSAQRANQGYATYNKAIGVAQIEGQASWELDLFGRNQALTAQATAILQSQEISQQAVRVSLLADVARSYFDLRSYQQQIVLTKQNLETQKMTLQITLAQKQGALASDFDVQRTAAQVSTTESLIPALESAHDQALNRLNVLLGLPPGSRDTLVQEAGALKPLDHHIVIAAPAKVMATRPDVRVAERNFAASISATDAARAQVFPDISLTALFGAQTATGFAPMNPWSVGLNLTQPILNFGRIEAQIDQADSRQRQSFLTYQQTVLSALEDMENSLSSYIHESQRNASLTTSVGQNRRAMELAQQQYQNGYTGLLDVLVAERDLLDAESNQTASSYTLRKNLVSIYAAAGGGWEE